MSDSQLGIRHTQFSRWPSRTGELAGTLSLCVSVPDGGWLVLRQWIDTGSMPSTQQWPASGGGVGDPTIMCGPGGEPPYLALAIRFDQDDDVIAESSAPNLASHDDIVRRGRYSTSLEAASYAAFHALASGLEQTVPDVADDEWYADAIADATLDQNLIRSWHRRIGDRHLRILKDSSPVWDAEIEHERASRYLVMDPREYRTGIIIRVHGVDGPSAYKWWPPGMTPYLDAPIIGNDIPEPYASVLELLR